MKDIKEHLSHLDWTALADEMIRKGHTLIQSLLSPAICEELIAKYSDAAQYRKTISMERYRFGAGEYKYFNYPLPSLIEDIRKEIYPRLAPIANTWMNVLGIEKTFPGQLHELHQLCRDNGQDKPTVLILKYGTGGYNTLHQDLYGDIFFPMQAVIFLNKYNQDYTGGEFVLTEQIPRAQSRAIVLHPDQGDMLLFTTNFRPVKGTRGYYRVNMKHGVSEVHSGERHTVGIIFHDASS